MITDKDGQPGLRLESAASVTIRDTIRKHMAIFQAIIRHDRAAGQSTTAAYIDGLAGTMALVVAGGHSSKDEVLQATIRGLTAALDRDLKHLK